LGFTSTNDRLFVSILKELGFLDADGVPTERYYRYHDRSQSTKVLAERIREAYSDLFAVNQEAHKLSAEDVTNKLRTLYKGSKTDQVIGRIARTFAALCENADFSDPQAIAARVTTAVPPQPERKSDTPRTESDALSSPRNITLDALQYHINIVLPESRDQSVYDAIFRSLRDHLGQK